ncbi:putative quinol monooxygenase [Thalassotalea sediminis]|uniref:putative quinol monooxygenase n=1 Tax=Thalassotalea sediminis TaxID=1759089 RepID=UPI0025737946|nr:antibiotic biosynthesis monooxygenase family protein [Thalassotalea sediminis]
MAIYRVNQFYAAEGKGEMLKAFFESLVEYIISSKGCISCQLLQDDQNELHFVVLEQWQSKEAHQASLQNYPADKMQEVMPLFGTPPIGDFYTLVKE